MSLSDLHFIPKVEFPCTFCKGRLQAVTCVENGEDAIVHIEPACAKFLDTDLLDFMIENRRALGIPDPPEEDN